MISVNFVDYSKKTIYETVLPCLPKDGATITFPSGNRYWVHRTEWFLEESDSGMESHYVQIMVAPNEL